MMNQVMRGHDQRDHNDHGAIDVDVGAGDRHRTGHPVGDVHLLEARAEPLDMPAEERSAEFEAHRLLKENRDAPGREQRVEETAIQVADDQALDRQPDQRGHHEGDRNGRQEAEMQPDARHDGRVGAHHHEIAMGHVDDAHRAVGDGEAKGDHEQDRAEAQAYEDDVKHSGLGASAADSPPRKARAPRTPQKRSEHRRPAPPSERRRPPYLVLASAAFSFALSTPLGVQNRLVSVSP